MYRPKTKIMFFLISLLGMADPFGAILFKKILTNIDLTFEANVKFTFHFFSDFSPPVWINHIISKHFDLFLYI